MSSGPWTDLRCGSLPALLLALLFGAAPAVAGDWLSPHGDVQVGADGVARSLFRPEFRAAAGLRDQLAPCVPAGAKVQLVTPFVPVPRPPGARQDLPPAPARLLITGPLEAVREARALLSRLDSPRRAVFVSILVSEVEGWSRLNTGGSLVFDKGAGTDPENTFFRGFRTDFEPDDFLRSTLTGAAPFEGTALRLGDRDVSGGDFQYTLRALAKSGDAEFLAWPSLLCNEEEPGTVESVREVPQTLVRDSPSDNLGVDLRQENVGLKLRVTPQRIGADTAVLDLDVWLRLPEPITDGTAPLGTLRLKLRQVRTQVSVRDREPLLLGGLVLRHGQRQRSGLPRPVSLAVLDPLHSSRLRDSRETEILFLVRARVVLPCRRPSELDPEGYEAWTRGVTPGGRRLRSPWAYVPQGAVGLDETPDPPLAPTGAGGR